MVTLVGYLELLTLNKGCLRFFQVIETSNKRILGPSEFEPGVIEF